MSQIDLFASEPELPEGFIYKPEFISHEAEQTFVRAIEQLEFSEVKMHDVVAKRRVRGPSRTRWQHRIAPVKQRRLSITFRTLRTKRV